MDTYKLLFTCYGIKVVECATGEGDHYSYPGHWSNEQGEWFRQLSLNTDIPFTEDEVNGILKLLYADQGHKPQSSGRNTINPIHCTRQESYMLEYLAEQDKGKNEAAKKGKVTHSRAA